MNLVIDGGEGAEGESTVVSCLNGEPDIVRQGDGTLI